MILQKQISRKVGSTEYAKYVIVIKQELVEGLGWKAGDGLEAQAKGKELLISRQRNQNSE